MKVVNNSKSKAYYTQRNNELNPNNACNVTSIVTALHSTGWSFPEGRYTQAEDNLMDYILTSPIIKEEWDRIDPNHSAPPNQWYTLLMMGTNLWLKDLHGPKIYLTWMLNITKYKKSIDKGEIVVFSGKFETKRSTITHIVAGVGYRSIGSGISDLIIDDPYGDYNDQYTTVIGNDKIMPYSDFISKGFPYGKQTKLGIIVPKYVKGE